MTWSRIRAAIVLALPVVGVALAALFVFSSRPAPAQSQNPGLATLCSQSVIYDASTAGLTKLVSGTATKQIYVCGFNFFAGGTVNVSLKFGTGTACGTGTTALTPAYQLVAQTGIVDHQPYYAGLTPVPVSNDLCINASGGVAVQAVIYFAQF